MPSRVFKCCLSSKTRRCSITSKEPPYGSNEKENSTIIQPTATTNTSPSKVQPPPKPENVYNTKLQEQLCLQGRHLLSTSTNETIAYPRLPVVRLIICADSNIPWLNDSFLPQITELCSSFSYSVYVFDYHSFIQYGVETSTMLPSIQRTVDTFFEGERENMCVTFFLLFIPTEHYPIDLNFLKFSPEEFDKIHSRCSDENKKFLNSYFHDVNGTILFKQFQFTTESLEEYGHVSQKIVDILTPMLDLDSVRNKCYSVAEYVVQKILSLDEEVRNQICVVNRNSDIPHPSSYWQPLIASLKSKTADINFHELSSDSNVNIEEICRKSVSNMFTSFLNESLHYKIPSYSVPLFLHNELSSQMSLLNSFITPQNYFEYFKQHLAGSKTHIFRCADELLRKSFTRGCIQYFQEDFGKVNCVFRFANSSPKSTSLPQLLNSIVNQLCILTYIKMPTAYLNIDECKSYLTQIFKRITEANRCAIILEGMDKFHDAFDLFPSELPNGLHIVYFVNSCEKTCEKIDTLAPKLEDVFVKEYLSKLNIGFPEESLCNLQFTSMSERYISYVLNTEFRSLEQSKLFSQLFPGCNPVLNSLKAARHGLTQHELFELLKKHNVTSGPLLYFYLHTLFYPFVAIVCDEYSDMLQIHSTYFSNLLNENGVSWLFELFLSPILSTNKCRNLVELPWHTAKTSSQKALDDFILNSSWLISYLNKAYPGYLLELMDTFFAGDERSPDLRMLYNVIALSASTITLDHQHWKTQVYLRLMNCDLERLPLCSSLRSSLAESVHIDFEISSSLVPDLVSPAEASVNIPKNDCFELGVTTVHLKRIKGIFGHTNDFIVVLDINQKKIILWDYFRGKPIRIFENVNRPRDIKFFDATTAVLLSGRDLKVVDLDEGKVVIKLRGTLNNDLPLYGIHDKDSVVALSRNRMYVNIISVSRNTHITTFKVGEDRFLNSLLVSEDGSHVVCGDETQKPFPLLIWDLGSLKLMYDIRINGHEFEMAKAIVSGNGKFAATVVRELQSDQPNFVIVYDITNGQVHRKWRPEFSTVALAIADNGSIAAVSLSNATITIYSLATGGELQVLTGHCAPVDGLSFSSDASRLLSFCVDSFSLYFDRSIRLWEVSTGTCLLSFTPDYFHTAVLLSCVGDSIFVMTDEEEQKAKVHTIRCSKDGYRPKEDYSFGSREHESVNPRPLF